MLIFMLCSLILCNFIAVTPQLLISMNYSKVGLSLESPIITNDQKKISTSQINNKIKIQKELVNQTKVYAFYFPQFHEDELNNRLWGKGYTDWENVKQAPLHNRYNDLLLRPDPVLGYYDLTDIHIRKFQAELARNFSVDGFIYHHYWFHNENETAVLSKPLELLLLDGQPNISFALNWAMDTWLGTWHGRGKLGEILYEQRCPKENDIRYVKHYQFLRSFFHHPNYIMINHVPLFMVLRSQPGKCLRAFAALRQLAMKDGFPAPGLYIIEGARFMSNHELYTGKALIAPKGYEVHYDGDFYYPFALFANQSARMPHRCQKPHGVQQLAERMRHRAQYLSLIATFDNTPRRDRQNSTIWDRKFFKAGPIKSFQLDLVTTMMYERCCQTSAVREQSGKFVVINAWNEWGEGMALEPSNVYGYKFLDAVKAAKAASRTIGCHWSIYRNYVHKMTGRSLK